MKIMYKAKTKRIQICINAIFAFLILILLIIYNNVYNDLQSHMVHVKHVKLWENRFRNSTNLYNLSQSQPTESTTATNTATTTELTTDTTTVTTTVPTTESSTETTTVPTTATNTVTTSDIPWENLNITKPMQPPKGYLVWSENCHMPGVDLLENDYMKIYEPHTPPNCTEMQPLVTKSFNKSLQSYVLYTNMDLKNEYLNATDGDIQCCYKKVLRNGDKDFDLMECEPFDQEYIMPSHVDNIIIECSDSTNTTIYKDGMAFIQNRPSVNAKFENNTHSRRPFGILLFGIDTISQFNFRRVMPETFAYVQNSSWYELSGYNKIEDNTFPNLMAIFTGLNLSKADEICQFHEPGGIDNCTTLFNLFNRQGMATAYSEDSCEMSTFDYLKPGFVHPPTDYYQRPLLLAIEKKLPIKELSGLTYCIGPRRYAEYVYDYGVEFAERFVGQSIFGLFWTNSFSHNDWIDPATMDHRMVEYFNYMDSKEILDNNVVILFSDHGARWGFLRNQKEGYIEERLPMFFMRLPQWFQDAHPDIVQALSLNKNRLTSPYDVHITLRHLALLSLGKYEGIDLPLSCLTCQTLFEPVLENRTCEMAGIDEHWCTCTPFETMDGDTEAMVNVTNLIINEINLYINESAYGDNCAPLVFKRNIEANLRLDLHENAHSSRMQTYRMNFEVNPNEALFDATCIYDTLNKNLTVAVTEISRLNSYAKDSACIDDNVMKKYCICKNSVKTS